MTNAVTQPVAAPNAVRDIWRDTERCLRAAGSRDSRFDGQFIVAVRSTGIYCKPSCPAQAPKPSNMVFYPTAAAAQTGGFRACKRCLPDAVPGSPEWNVRGDLAARAMRLIGDGTVEREGVPGLARRLGYSQRQLTRTLTAELGASPLALARAHRAHAARLLLQATDLSVTDVAFAAGFRSLRQFNDTVREVFATVPSALRGLSRAATTGPHRQPEVGALSGVRLTLRLPYREPFDTDGTFGFLAVRAVGGVEHAISSDDGAVAGFQRTLRLPHGTGLAQLRERTGHVECTLRLADVRDLGAAVARVRRLLDLDADPVAVADTLSADPALAPLLRRQPGARLPGAVDGPELVLRAMLGQQVSVAAARTAASRLTTALGDPMPEARADEPDMLFPTAAEIAEHGGEVLRGPGKRVDAVRTVAGMLASGDLAVHFGRDLGDLRAELLAAPGIGPWTADYVLMRVLNATDVLLDGDLGIRKGAGCAGLPSNPEQLRAHAPGWRPWRSYACMYLWRACTAT